MLRLKDTSPERIAEITNILNKRMEQIKAIRAERSSNIDDPNPMLIDIERIHALFVKPQFRPFRDIGYAYIPPVNIVIANNAINANISNITNMDISNDIKRPANNDIDNTPVKYMKTTNSINI